MEIALADLQDGVRRASAEVVKVLRTEPDVQAVTPGGEWTVRETAVHLICGIRKYTILLEGRPSRFQTSFDLSAWNSALFLAMDEDHPSVLANLVEDAVRVFLEESERHDHDDTHSYQGLTMTTGGQLALSCWEYLLHGYDIETALGRPWTCPDPIADQTMLAMSAALRGLINTKAGTEVQACVAIESPSIRICYALRHDGAELLGGDSQVDCSISGTPSDLMLWLSGRADWNVARLSASGKVPELGPVMTEMLKRMIMPRSSLATDRRLKPARLGLGRMLVFEVIVKPDALDEFGALIREIVPEDEAAEPGSRILECFIDGQDAHFYERYQDSAAALTHPQRFGENYASRLFALCTPGRVSVYGEPSEEVKAVLAAFSPRYLEPVAGFAGR
jgi:uncharacterized protein (TIGR03083 family)